MKRALALLSLLFFGTTVVAAQEAAKPILNSARFEQVAITVTDLESALQFYQNQLGLRLMFRANDMLFFDVGGVRLMVALDKHRETPERPTSIAYFHVDDFAVALKRLATSDATLVGPLETVQTSGDGSLQLQLFEDDDGNMFSIIGFVPN